MLTPAPALGVSIGHRENTLSPMFSETRKRNKMMTYNYHLRSAVAAVFATTFTLLFAVITTTGGMLPGPAIV